MGQQVGGRAKYFKYKYCEVNEVIMIGKYLETSLDPKYKNPRHTFLDKNKDTVVLNSAGGLNWKIEKLVEGDNVVIVYKGTIVLDKGTFKGSDCHQFGVAKIDSLDDIEDIKGTIALLKAEDIDKPTSDNDSAPSYDLLSEDNSFI